MHHLDGAVRTGSLTAVVGPNGAGKSTLFKGVVGVIKPLAGRIERNGVRPQDIAYLPQVAEIDRSFPISVYDMVAMGLWRGKGLFGGIGAQGSRHASKRAIAAVGLTGFEPRPIGTLSGGQMQRMLFARLLLQDARVIVLDEPFNAIDAKTSRRSSGSGAALARRAAHRAGRAARSRDGQGELPRGAAAGARAGGLGPDRRRADARRICCKARRMCEAFDEQAEACVVGGGRLSAMLSHIFIAPFADRVRCRALVAAILALALGAGPIGVFLMLRRMSLVGDAMAHAILPGVAIGFLVAGLNMFAMTLGGLVAGFCIALLAGAVSRATALAGGRLARGFLLVSLALGVTIVTINGTNIDQLMSSCSARRLAKMNADKLLVIAGQRHRQLIALALIYRPLVLECVDPGFLRSVSRAGGVAHLAFLALVVINLGQRLPRARHACSASAS